MGFGRGIGLAGLVLAGAIARTAVAEEVDLAAAERQFVSSCGVCHVVDPDAPARQGPPLAGILGRAAGSRAGYAYSDALKRSGIVWTEETLDRWIENAQAYVPGTTMMYRQAKPERRQLIIAYLKSLGG
jgi:cytochrome c